MFDSAIFSILLFSAAINQAQSDTQTNLSPAAEVVPLSESKGSAAAASQSRPIVVKMGPAPAIDNACQALPGAQLQNVTCSDAASLMLKLKDAQARLRKGEQLYFDLLAGAPASDAMTKVSPREAFLNIPFERAFILKRIGPKDRLSNTYKFAYRPNKAVPAIWDIEVLFLFNHERLGRVEMRYGPPPPF